MTTTLNEVFDKLIEAPMKRLGYCCGMRHFFSPETLYCSGKQVCVIQRDKKYYCLSEGVSAPINYCEQCWATMGNPFALPQEENGRMVRKALFQERVNDKLEQERFVNCTECGRKNHEICVLWHKGLAHSFVCRLCLKDRPPNPFTAAALPRTKLGDHLEKRIVRLMRDYPEHAKISVCVVSIREKTVVTQPYIRGYYSVCRQTFSLSLLLSSLSPLFPLFLSFSFFLSPFSPFLFPLSFSVTDTNTQSMLLCLVFCSCRTNALMYQGRTGYSRRVSV